ncbi:YczE/YyaS/YitT family protein [Lactobacillaceae bacterium Scapto_B20]
MTGNQIDPSMMEDQYDKPMKKHRFLNLFLRSLMSLVGISVLSIGAAFLKQSGLGLDPFTAMNIGFSSLTHIPLGTLQLATNGILFLIVLIFDRKQIGIGTIMNMVLVGYEIEFFVSMYSKLFPTATGDPFVMIVDVVVGVILFTMGTSMYISPSLGASPYDAIAPIILKYTKLKYQLVRSIQDITIMVIAFFATGPVGVLTIIVSFFAGPLISYWNEHFSQKIVYHINRFSTKPTAKNAGSAIAGIGKFGYQLVWRAYQETNFVEQHVAGYTNEQLIQEAQKTEVALHRSISLQQSLETRLSMIDEEAKKRNIKIPKVDLEDYE